MSLAAVIERCKSRAAATPATAQISMALRQKSAFFRGEIGAATPATPATAQITKVQTPNEALVAQKPGFCYGCYGSDTPTVTAKKTLFSEEKLPCVTAATAVTSQITKVQTRINEFAEKTPAIEPTECGSYAIEGAENLDLGRLDLPVPAPPDNSAVVAANKALYTRLVLAGYRACSTPEERLSMRADCLEIELEHVLELAEHFEKAYPVMPPPSMPKHWSLEPSMAGAVYRVHPELRGKTMEELLAWGEAKRQGGRESKPQSVGGVSRDFGRPAITR